MRCRSWLTGQSRRSSETGEGVLMIWFGPVPTASGGLDPQPIPRFQPSFALRRDRPAIQQVAARRRGGASVPAVGCVAAPLGDQGEAHRFPCLQLADDSITAAVAAASAAPSPHRELPDHHGEVSLERLDGRVEGVRHRHVLGARTVCVPAGALAAADRLVVGPVIAGERQVVHRPLPLGPDRRELGQRGKDQVGDAARGLDVAADDGCGRMRVEQRSLGGSDGHRAPGAGRRRRVRVADDADGVEAGRLGHRERAVEVAGDLIRAAREVEIQRVPPNGGADTQRNVAIAALEDVLCRALAVGHLRERGPRAPLRVVEDLAGRGPEQLPAMPLGELPQPAVAGQVRCPLRPQVGQPLLRVPHPPGQLTEDRVVRARRGNDHALLVQRHRERRHAARRRAADVGVMGAAGGEADQPLIVEDRRDQGDVREVGPAAVGVIEDPEIALVVFFADDHGEEHHEGDLWILNDPYRGGTHLPDITLISPVFHDEGLIGFAASRAHHADIGGPTPGGMPALSVTLDEEGVVIPPTRADDAVLAELAGRMRNPEQRLADLRAQRAANLTGNSRLRQLAERHGRELLRTATGEILDYAERRTRAALAEMPDGESATEDVLEGRDGDIPLRVSATVRGDTLDLDFTGSADQVSGNLNCPLSVTKAACFYAVRVVCDPDAPPSAGAWRPVTVGAPKGSLLNAHPPAAVVGGNVETSSRIADLVFAALAEFAPVGAEGQGTMNNLTLSGDHWTYYETIGGGQGACRDADGPSAEHVAMSNTLNTPIEALETDFPVVVRELSVRRGSGGGGRHRGGDGIVRELEARESMRFTLIAERRRHAPHGRDGGAPAAPGRDLLDGRPIAPKSEGRLKPGDRLRIETPGGGGYGAEPNH